MPQWILTLLTIVASIMASSGFWAFIQHRTDKKDAKKDLLIALAHERICHICNQLLDRGDWITEDEYENLKVLWTPYDAAGGNHTAKKLYGRVEKELKIVDRSPSSKEANPDDEHII